MAKHKPIFVEFEDDDLEPLPPRPEPTGPKCARTTCLQSITDKGHRHLASDALYCSSLCAHRDYADAMKALGVTVGPPRVDRRKKHS